MPAAARRAVVTAADDGSWTLASDAGGPIASAVLQNLGSQPVALGFTADAATEPASTAGLVLGAGEGIPKDALPNLQTVGDVFAVWFRSLRAGRSATLFVDHAAGS